MSIEFYEDYILDTDTGKRYAFSCPWNPGLASLDIPEFLRRQPGKKPAPVVTAAVKPAEDTRQMVREWKWKTRNRRKS